MEQRQGCCSSVCKAACLFSRLSTQHNQYTADPIHSKEICKVPGDADDNTLAVRSMMQLRSVGGLYAAAQLRL